MTHFTPPYPEESEQPGAPKNPYHAQPYLHSEYTGQNYGAPTQNYGTVGQNYGLTGAAPMYPYGPGGVLPNPRKQSKAWIWWLVGLCSFLVLTVVAGIIVIGMSDTALSPSETAYAYSQAWDSADCDAYGDLTTANLRAEDEVDSCAALKALSADWQRDYPGIIFEVNSVSMDGDRAIANVVFTPTNGPAFKQAWELIQVNGEWRLDSFGGFDGNGSEPAPPEPDPI